MFSKFIYAMLFQKWVVDAPSSQKRSILRSIDFIVDCEFGSRMIAVDIFFTSLSLSN